MTMPSRRQAVLLLVLLLAAAGVLIVRPFGGSTNGPATGAGGAAGRTAGSKPDTGVPDVRLGLLDRQEDAFQTPVRNPFRFERRATAGAATGPVRTRRVDPPPQPTGPPPIPPPPPIPLRFIGFLQPDDGATRIAVLSDGRGTVIDAKEGDVVEGRYRLLRVGNDSADLVYLDGRGRQTIRLSGQ